MTGRRHGAPTDWPTKAKKV